MVRVINVYRISFGKGEADSVANCDCDCPDDEDL